MAVVTNNRDAVRGAYVKNFRITAGMTQKYVAMRMKLSQAYISAMERGAAPMEDYHLATYGDIVGMSEYDIANAPSGCKTEMEVELSTMVAEVSKLSMEAQIAAVAALKAIMRHENARDNTDRNNIIAMRR